jgi:hypothetical protein
VFSKRGSVQEKNLPWWVSNEVPRCIKKTHKRDWNQDDSDATEDSVGPFVCELLEHRVREERESKATQVTYGCSASA